MSHEFKDKDGREWPLKMTVGRLVRYEALTGRSLTTEIYEVLKRKDEFLFAPAVTDGGEPRERPMEEAVAMGLGILFPRTSDLVAVLYCMCEPVAKERKIDMDAFAELLDGEVLTEAVDAAWGTLSDFTRSLTGRLTMATAATKAETPKKKK